MLSVAAWLSCIFHAFLCLLLRLHAWPAAPDWQQHDMGRPADPKGKKTQRETHNSQNAHRNRQTIRQRNTPHTLEKPTQRQIHRAEPLLATKGNNSNHLSNNAAWFLSVKGRQRDHILDTEQSYSDRAEEERPPSKLQNVKQMTHAWYAGNIPDVCLLMGGKWKSIFTFHPPRHPITGHCFYRDISELKTAKPHITSLTSLT